MNLFAVKLKTLTKLFDMKLKTLTKLLSMEIAPENGLTNTWIPLGIAVVCFAVAYTHSQPGRMATFLVDNEQLSTQANDYKKARSIKTQMLGNLTDEELAIYCVPTGQTAEQLDKEEAEFKKACWPSPKSLKSMWKIF